MRIFIQPVNLYDTPIARSDSAYRDWLGRWSFAAERLTGVNPIHDLSLAPAARRWFRAGVEPYDAVKRWQRRYVSRD